MAAMEKSVAAFFISKKAHDKRREAGKERKWHYLDVRCGWCHHTERKRPMNLRTLKTKGICKIASGVFHLSDCPVNKDMKGEYYARGSHTENDCPCNKDL